MVRAAQVVVETLWPQNAPFPYSASFMCRKCVKEASVSTASSHTRSQKAAKCSCACCARASAIAINWAQWPQDILGRPLQTIIDVKRRLSMWPTLLCHSHMCTCTSSAQPGLLTTTCAHLFVVVGPSVSDPRDFDRGLIICYFTPFYYYILLWD